MSNSTSHERASLNTSDSRARPWEQKVRGVATGRPLLASSASVFALLLALPAHAQETTPEVPSDVGTPVEIPPEPSTEQESSPEDSGPAESTPEAEGTSDASAEAEPVENSEVDTSASDSLDSGAAQTSSGDYYADPDPFVPTLSAPTYTEVVDPPYDGPFRGGQLHLGLSIGFQGTSEQSWFAPGVSVGYFLVNGLMAHVDTDFWIGDPFIVTPSPGLQFVFFMIPVVNPYVGAFYRHYFVGDGGLDVDSVGGRGGVYFLTGERSYFGGGVVYERILNDGFFARQDIISPEIAFVFSF